MIDLRDYQGTDTERFQAAFEDIRRGAARRLYIPDGQYQLDHSVKCLVVGVAHAEIDATGAIVRPSPEFDRSQGDWMFVLGGGGVEREERCEGFTLRGLRIYGNDSFDADPHGLCLQYITHGLFDDVQVIRLRGTGIQAFAAWDWKIRDTYIMSCGHHDRQAPGLLLDAPEAGRWTNRLVLDYVTVERCEYEQLFARHQMNLWLSNGCKLHGQDPKIENWQRVRRLATFDHCDFVQCQGTLFSWGAPTPDDLASVRCLNKTVAVFRDTAWRAQRRGTGLMRLYADTTSQVRVRGALVYNPYDEHGERAAYEEHLWNVTDVSMMLKE